MTKPHVHKPGEDDTTDLSIPRMTVSQKLTLEEPPIHEADTEKSRPIIEEPPIDEADTEKSRPDIDVLVVTISENSSIVDAETTTSSSVRSGNSKSQSSNNKQIMS